MPELQPCPSRAQIESLLTGEALDVSAEDLTEHLEVCAACSDLAEELEADLADALRFGPQVSSKHISDMISSVLALGRTPSEVRLRAERTGPLPYELQEHLGAGGMGVIWSAQDSTLGRVVALKRTRERGEGSARLCEEALVMAQLDHPGIPPVHELSWSETLGTFFTMKRVEGCTLADRLSALASGREPWSRDERLEVFRRICEAVAFAHARGVLHRDLKPGNVMLGEYGQVYVMDWGLARKIEGIEEKAPTLEADRETGILDRASGASRAGSVLGTPRYMAPEQARGERVDVRADVYGLGAVLCELLSLRSPYAELDGDTLLDVARKGDPTPLDLRAGEPIPWELGALIHKATAADPAKRYSSVNEVLADLSAYRTGHSLRAVEYGLRAQALTWLRRHRRRVLSGVVLGLAILAGVAANQVRAAWAKRAREVALGQARSRLDARAAGVLEQRRKALGGAQDLSSLAALTSGVSLANLRAAALEGQALAPAKPVTLQGWAAEAIGAAERDELLAVASYRQGELLGEGPAALAAYSRAVRLAPLGRSANRTRLLLGKLHLGRGNPQRACELASHVASSTSADDPLFLRARTLLASGQLGLGRVGGAWQALGELEERIGSGDRALVELLRRFRRTSPLPAELAGAARGSLVAAELDGEPGAELVARQGGDLIAFRWDGAQLAPWRRAKAPPGSSFLFGDLDGDGRDECVTVRSRRLQVWRWPPAGLTPWSSEIPVPGPLGRALDLDGDGRDEVYVQSRSSASPLLVRWASGAWRVQPIDPALRSLARAFLLEIRPEGRFLLVAAGQWQQFALVRYRWTREEVFERVSTQRCGLVQTLVDAGARRGAADRLLVSVIGTPHYRIPTLLGRRLERSLPGGNHLLARRGLAFAPVDGFGKSASEEGSVLAPWVLRVSGSTWGLSHDGTRTWLRRLDDSPERTPSLALPLPDARPLCVADLDGDGLDELVTSARLYGIGKAAPLPPRPDSTGDSSLYDKEPLLALGDDLLRLGFDREAERTFRRSWEEAREGGGLSWGYAGLRLAACLGEREANEEALAVARKVRRFAPALAREAWLLTANLAAEEGKRETFEIARRHLLPTLAAHEARDLQRLAQRVRSAGAPFAGQRSWRTSPERFIRSRPDLARDTRAGVRLRQGLGSASLWTPYLHTGESFRLRVRFRVRQFGFGGRIGIAASGLQEGLPTLSARLQKRGGSWNLRESLTYEAHSREVGLPAGSLASSGELELSLEYSAWNQSVRSRLYRVEPRRLLLEASRDASTFGEGWYRAGVFVWGEASARSRLTGVVDVADLEFAHNEGRVGRPPDYSPSPPSLDKSYLDARALQTFLAPQGGSVPELTRGYYQLQAADRRAVLRGLRQAGVRSAECRAALRRGDLSVGQRLLALDFLATEGPLDPGDRKQLLDALETLACWSRLLVEVDRLPLSLDRRRRRGRALLGAERFSEAAVILEQVAARSGESADEALHLRAWWGREALVGRAPRPTVAGYDLGAAFQLH